MLPIAPFITAKISILKMEKALVSTLYLSLELLPEAFPDAQWLCRPFSLICQYETLSAFFSAEQADRGEQKF